MKDHTSKNNEFIEKLMKKAFNLKAPPMPDFDSIPKEDTSRFNGKLLNSEELDSLAAAGNSSLHSLDFDKEKKEDIEDS